MRARELLLDSRKHGGSVYQRVLMHTLLEHPLAPPRIMLFIECVNRDILCPKRRPVLSTRGAGEVKSGRGQLEACLTGKVVWRQDSVSGNVMMFPSCWLIPQFRPGPTES